MIKTFFVFVSGIVVGFIVGVNVSERVKEEARRSNQDMMIPDVNLNIPNQ